MPTLAVGLLRLLCEHLTGFLDAGNKCYRYIQVTMPNIHLPHSVLMVGPFDGGKSFSFFFLQCSTRRKRMISITSDMQGLEFAAIARFVPHGDVMTSA